MKSTKEFCFITLKSVQRLEKNWLLVQKMIGIWWMLKWIVSSGKSETLHFNVLLFSTAYNVPAKKLQENYLSWHLKKIQASKKNWLFVWKMTWEIWWTLTRAVESLKICTLIGYFCRNYVMFELKIYREVLSWNMSYGFKTDISNLGIFTQAVESNVR